MPPRDEQTPTKPKVPTKLTPENAKAIRDWHNTPLFQRLQTLQSGKDIPGFIKPGSVNAREDYLERMIARQSQQKDPLTPENQPATPKPQAGGAPEINQLLSMLAGGEQTNPENPDRDTTDNPYPEPAPTPAPPPPTPTPPVAPPSVSPEQTWTPQDQQQYQDTQKWEQAVPNSNPEDIVDTRWMPWEDSHEALDRARMQSAIENMLQGPSDPFASDPLDELLRSVQEWKADPFTMIRMGVAVDPTARVPFHHFGMPDQGSAARGGRFPWMYEDYGNEYGPGGEGRYSPYSGDRG